MNSIITSMRTVIAIVATTVVLFAVSQISIASAQSYSYEDYYDAGYGVSGGDSYYYDYGSSYSTPTSYSYADYYDYGYGTSGGDVYSYPDYGGTTDLSTYTYADYYGSGYGTSGGDVIDNGCCDSTASIDWDNYDYASYYGSGYGTSGGDVIDNGCCDTATVIDWENYSYADYYGSGYGTSGGDVIDNGCCDNATVIDWDNYSYEQDEYEYQYDEPAEYVEYSYGTPSYSYGSHDYSHDYVYAYNDNYSYPTYTHTNPTPKPRPTCTLTVDPGSIDEGEHATLAWTTSNATSISINNEIGSVSESGTKSVSPATSKTYTLVATGKGGSVTCSDTIIVKEDTNNNEDVSCDAFTVNDSNVEEGDEVTLTWRTTGADDVDINNGVGDVADDGSEKVTVDRDTTFTLTARNGSDTDTCKITVNVDEDTNNNDDVSCDAFTVSDSRVEEGDEVTLKWRTTGADDVDINNGVGDVDEDGSEEVTVKRDTTFTLTARNGSDTDTCRVTVNVEEDNSSSDTAPRCSLHISDTKITANQKVTLSWDNTRTDRIILKDSTGHEILDSRDDRDVDEDKDSVVVHPTRSTDYTLTVYNGSKKKTCTVGADIEGVVVTSVRSQDGISLTKVPYTGFEAGPLLTFIFYGAIVLWGMVIAYALVIRKKAAVVGAEMIAHTPHISASVSDAVVDDITFPLTSGAPEHLPTDEVEDVDMNSTEDTVRALETHAHSKLALISSDALRLIESQKGTLEEQMATLDHVIDLAKARFPKESDWIVINKERVMSLLG